MEEMKIEEMCIGEIKARILETEHKIIHRLSLWDQMENDRTCLEVLSFINGINKMAYVMLEEMCGDELESE